MDEQSVQEKIILIRKLWEEHKSIKFPKGLGGEEINGIDLALLDADTAGCIDTFLKSSNQYTLDVSRTAMLGLCYRDLSNVSAWLVGAPKDYFQRLEALALLVLEVLTKETR